MEGLLQGEGCMWRGGRGGVRGGCKGWGGRGGYKWKVQGEGGRRGRV